MSAFGSTPKAVDVVVIGAGAAGLFAAAEAGRRGRSVLVLDHGRHPGAKILISGGGRCNFTNLHTAPDRFLCANRHFPISALKRFGAQDFIARVDRAGIAWHEKTLGQLFCDSSARQIVDMLVDDCRDAGVELRMGTSVSAVTKSGERFLLETSAGAISAASVVVATGGLSIPKLGASGFAYDLAARFGLALVERRPGLVPLTFAAEDPRNFRDLTGIATDVTIRCGTRRFAEALLFTHRGISGPAVLQISSYWREGAEISVDFSPGLPLAAALADAAKARPKAEAKTLLAELLPRRLALRLVPDALAERQAGQIGAKQWQALADSIHDWRLQPDGSEGYRTAEVTLGGVDTDGLSSRTMEAKAVPGLFFIGEAVDVTGWLGGYNFQWAWSSGWVAGQHA